MYSKDYVSSQAGATTSSISNERAATTKVSSSQHNSTSHPKSSTSQHGATLNKSLENVIRKAAYKGIEPLRRRYTAGANSTSISNASYAQASRRTALNSNNNAGLDGKSTTASRKTSTTHDSNNHNHY